MRTMTLTLRSHIRTLGVDLGSQLAKILPNTNVKLSPRIAHQLLSIGALVASYSTSKLLEHIMCRVEIGFVN
jgi:hypothetical protein